MDLEKLKFWKNQMPKLSLVEGSAPESSELAKKTENARKQASEVIKRLDEENFDKARDIFTRNFFRKKYDRETQILVEGSVIPYAREKIIKYIVNGRGDELVRMIAEFRGYLRNGEMDEKVAIIKPDDLKQIPEDVLKSPEIIKKIHSYLIEQFRLDPVKFEYWLELYSKLGFIMPEEIIKLPEIKEAARVALQQSPGEIRYSSSPMGDLQKLFPQKTFAELKKIFLELGILDEKEIEQIRTEK